MKQLTMFPAGEDLPLFSGTAPKGNIEVYDPSYVGHTMLDLDCKLCFDTGTVQVEPGVIRFCTCAKGDEARRQTQGYDFQDQDQVEPPKEAPCQTS